MICSGVLDKLKEEEGGVYSNNNKIQNSSTHGDGDYCQSCFISIFESRSVIGNVRIRKNYCVKRITSWRWIFNECGLELNSLNWCVMVWWSAAEGPLEDSLSEITWDAAFWRRRFGINLEGLLSSSWNLLPASLLVINPSSQFGNLLPFIWCFGAFCWWCLFCFYSS